MKMKQQLIQAEVLQEDYLIPNSAYDGHFSKTTQFMIPAIGINVNHKLIFKYFENAFLADRGHEHVYTRPIFMLFSIASFKEEDWKKVYHTLTQSKNYITEYDIGVKDGKYLFMMVFTIPEKYEKDYYNFRIGRYSLFSEDYKKKFLEYEDKNDEKLGKKNVLWQIINRDISLKNQIEKVFNTPNLLTKDDEIWERPRREREYYRYKCKTI